MSDALADRVVRCAEYQTSPKQPDTVRRATLARILARRSRESEGDRWTTVVSADDVREAIDEALADGRLQADPDDDGRVRVPGDGDGGAPSRGGEPGASVDADELDVPENAGRLFRALVDDAENGGGPWTATDAEATADLDVSKRSVQNYLRALVDEDALRKEVGEHAAAPTTYHHR